MNVIRLIVVEDNRLMREGLTAMLDEQTGFRVVASLGTGDTILKGKRVRGDVVLLDVGLRSQSSLKLVSALRTRHPALKVIVMDLAPTQSTLMEYVSAGVSGFVLKDATFASLIHTIKEVARGENVLPPLLTSSLFSQIADIAARRGKGNPFRFVKMTSREREVVELIAEGLSNKEIAVRLHLAVDTVKSHVHNVLEKLALHTRLEIASYSHAARQAGSSVQHNGDREE
jgi:DNA-binding NarL/FixJ family response regulator